MGYSFLMGAPWEKWTDWSMCVCVISTKVAYDGDVCVYRNGGDDECYVLGI